MPNRFLSIDDLANMPAPQWLIEGMFEVNSLVMLAGPSGHYKSFLLLDWLLHIVVGRPWQGKPVTQQKVLYCLGEGKASLLKRLNAWIKHARLSSAEYEAVRTGFKVTFEVPQMADPTDVAKTFSQLVVEGFSPQVVVFDTFARSFVGKDENDAKDTGLWIEQADRLRHNGYTVMFLHHTNKNVEFGYKYRGSSAIEGALDTAFTLAKSKEHPGMAQLRCSKQKDHDDDIEMWFKSMPVPAADSMVLIPGTKPVKMDETFVEAQSNEVGREAMITKFMADATFESDRARARAIAQIDPELGESAAQKRISRRRETFAETRGSVSQALSQG